jgi:hypothetical protein
MVPEAFLAGTLKATEFGNIRVVPTVATIQEFGPAKPAKQGSRMTHGWSEMKRACFEPAEYRLDVRLSLKSAVNTLKRMSLGDKAAF